MALTVLITGFGPFPGAPFNPTAALAKDDRTLRLSPGHASREREDAGVTRVANRT